MVERVWQPMWIGDAFFAATQQNPCECVIVEKEDTPKETIVMLERNGIRCRMSVWGENLRLMAVKLGDGRSFDTDKLVGLKCRVSQTTVAGKTRRTLVLS